jgi:hypothetical protein
MRTKKITQDKRAATLQTSLLPKTIHRLRANFRKIAPNPASQGTREDRSLRQMMTTKNSQTFFRICGCFSL